MYGNLRAWINVKIPRPNTSEQNDETYQNVDQNTNKNIHPFGHIIYSSSCNFHPTYFIQMKHAFIQCIIMQVQRYKASIINLIFNHRSYQLAPHYKGTYNLFQIQFELKLIPYYRTFHTQPLKLFIQIAHRVCAAFPLRNFNLVRGDHVCVCFSVETVSIFILHVLYVLMPNKIMLHFYAMCFAMWGDHVCVCFSVETVSIFILHVLYVLMPNKIMLHFMLCVLLC